MFHWAKAGFEQLDITEFSPCFLLGKAHSADVGLAEYGGGNEIVINDILLPAEVVACERHAFSERYRGQFHSTDHIPQGKNTGL